MSDLSKLSDAELEALSKGDMSKLSDASLRSLIGADPADTPAAPATEPAKARPARLGAEGGLLAGMVPGETVPGAAQAARYGVPLLGATGGLPGVAASGGGEKLAQMIEGEDRPGDVMQAMAMGGVPLGGARGVWAGIKEALKLGTAGAIGKQAQSLGNDGRMASAGDTGVAAALPAILGMLGRGVGRVAGAATNNVSPEELARVQAARLNNENADAVLARMQPRGAAVVPSSVNPSTKNKVLEMLAGTQNVEAGVARKNKPVFNAIARDEASIPADVAINEASLRTARENIGNQSYEAARKMGFSQELDNWREASTLLKKAQSDLNAGFTNARGQAVDDATKAMAAAEAAITAKAGGNPDAIKVLQDAKEAFGKNYDVEKAVPSGTDEVRASILSGLLEQRGEAGLSGGLQDIAQFNNNFSRSTKSPSRMASAPSAATPGMALAAAGGDPVQTAATAGSVFTIRDKIRDMLASPEYQAKNAVRNYTPATSADPVITAIIQRLLLQEEAARGRP